MKIYVVTSGEYSDYGIEGVTTNKKIAEEFVEAFNKGRCSPYDEMMVETYETDIIDATQGGKQWYFVSGVLGKGLTAEKTNLWGIKPTRTVKNNRTGIEYFQTYAVAKDEQHAVKIGSERMARLIYEREIEKALKEREDK